MTIENLGHKQRFEYWTIGKLTANIESGDLKLTDLATEETDVRCVFGEIRARDFSSGKTDIDINSGAVALHGALAGQTAVTSKFAAVTVETTLPKAEYTYDLRATSGGITIDRETME